MPMFRCVYPGLTAADVLAMPLWEINDHTEWAQNHLKGLYRAEG